MLLESLRRQVLTTAKDLPRYGLVWMAGGSACARDPETGYVVVTPSGLPYDDLSPEDMTVTTLHGEIVDGRYRPSVALSLWNAIFKARPDVNAVIHTHSPYATAFSVTYDSIPVVTETMADWFGASIPVAPYAHVEDPAFVTRTVETLGAGFAVLLGSHGPITVGKNLAHALERAVTLEESAKIYVIARDIGKPAIISDREAAEALDYYMNRYGQKASAKA